MPTLTGKTGPEGLIEELRALADEWDKVADSAQYTESMFGAVAKEMDFRQCARELRALVDGYEAGQDG